VSFSALCIYSILSQFSCPFYSKNSVFGFQNLQMKALPATREQTARRLLATTFVWNEMVWCKKRL